MKKKEHLPIYGVGPLYCVVIIGLTAAGISLSVCGLLLSVYDDGFLVPANCLAIFAFAIGIDLWLQAVLRSKIDDGIRQNRLVTTGVYAWVRNPIYSAFLFACTGALLLAHNLRLLLLPPLYWLLLTVFMKHTEEKWLLRQYGAAYKGYCQRTNRCIPWFPKQKQHG